MSWLPDQLIRSAGPPETGAVHTSGVGESQLVHARVPPSGESRGLLTRIRSLVTRQARPIVPSSRSGASQTSSSATKVSSEPRTCG